MYLNVASSAALPVFPPIGSVLALTAPRPPRPDLPGARSQLIAPVREVRPTTEGESESERGTGGGGGG